MSTAEIVSLVSTICGAVSAIAACITCLLTYRFTRPKIKVEIATSPKKCFFCHLQKPSGEIESVAYMEVKIYNASAEAGTIGGFEIIVNKMSISAETIGAHYNPPGWLHVNLERGYLKQDSIFYRLKVPRVIPAYSCVTGYFLFPKFPPVDNADKVSVTVKYKLIDRKLKVVQLRNITMYDLWKIGGYTLHFEGYIQNYVYYRENNYNVVKDTDNVTYSLEYSNSGF